MNPSPKQRDSWSANPVLAASIGKLQGKVALITDADRGLGHTIAMAFAKEGAHIALATLSDSFSVQLTAQAVEAEGVRCTTYIGDVRDAHRCTELVANLRKTYGRIDILVNNAIDDAAALNDGSAFNGLGASGAAALRSRTVFAMYEVTRQVLSLMKPGACIVNTACADSASGFRVFERPMSDDCANSPSATTAALASFTRSLAQQLLKRQIRVNAVAPATVHRGPAWGAADAGVDTRSLRASVGTTGDAPTGASSEEASAFVYLASGDSALLTARMLDAHGREATVN